MTIFLFQDFHALQHIACPSFQVPAASQADEYLSTPLPVPVLVLV